MIETLTQRAADHFGSIKGNQAFDPTIIMVIAEAIIQIIEGLRVYCAPESPEDGLSIVRNPSMLQKFWVRRVVRQKLGWSEYRRHGDDVLTALVRTGNEMTVEDMRSAYDSM